MKKTKHVRHGRSHSRADDHIPDPERIKEILNVVSDQVPELLKRLSDVLYSPDQAKKFGKAAAMFYRELKDAGMSEQDIFELTRDYMATLNVGNVFGKFAKDFDHDHDHDHEEENDYDDEMDFEEDLDEELKNHVRKRLRKKFQEK